MINTYTIYLSQWLKADYRSVYDALCNALNESHTNHALLPYSQEIWCRDYMPVHIGAGKYVGFVFKPDYLCDKNKNLPFITEQAKACSELDINFAVQIDIVLDGGNYVNCGSKMIMTDKIIMENPNLRLIDLINKLEKAFQKELILIPWDMDEPYGHADGMLAYIGNNQVILNNYSQFDKQTYIFAERIHKILNRHFDIIDLQYKGKLRKDSWCYLNYLETPEAIILPALSKQMDCDNDCSAKEVFQQIFPNKRILQIYTAPLVRNGGAIHCVTWEHYQ